jgi:NTP pyrophosphatase (non-canonical NTP hydrolase)
MSERERNINALETEIEVVKDEMRRGVRTDDFALRGLEAGLAALRVQQERENPKPLTQEDDTRNGFFALITAERAEQDRKWGYPQLNTLCEWASYLAEECGEAVKELNNLNFGKGRKEKLVNELVHTSAVCLAILQQYDVAVDITKQKREYVAYTNDAETPEQRGDRHLRHIMEIQSRKDTYDGDTI